jgi:hypothetical protein
MREIPLLHIIFYLTTLFLPNEMAKFTVSSGSDQKLTWVHQAGGKWRANDERGKDAGVWWSDGFTVSVTMNGKTTKTYVADFIKVGTISGQERHKFTITTTSSTITFSQDKDGIFADPVVVTYSTK